MATTSTAKSVVPTDAAVCATLANEIERRGVGQARDLTYGGQIQFLYDDSPQRTTARLRRLVQAGLVRSERLSKDHMGYGLTLEGYAQAWSTLPLCRCGQPMERGLDERRWYGHLCRECLIRSLERDAVREERLAASYRDQADAAADKADTLRDRIEELVA